MPSLACRNSEYVTVPSPVGWALTGARVPVRSTATVADIAISPLLSLLLIRRTSANTPRPDSRQPRRRTLRQRPPSAVGWDDCAEKGEEDRDSRDRQAKHERKSQHPFMLRVWIRLAGPEPASPLLEVEHGRAGHVRSVDVGEHLVRPHAS